MSKRTQNLIAIPSVLLMGLTISACNVSYDNSAERGTVYNGVAFGDDASKYAKDGECDDPRFSGTGMTNTTLVESDMFHDATDCLNAFKSGKIKLADNAAEIEGGQVAKIMRNTNVAPAKPAQAG